VFRWKSIKIGCTAEGQGASGRRDKTVSGLGSGVVVEVSSKGHPPVSGKEKDEGVGTKKKMTRGEREGGRKDAFILDLQSCVN